MARLTTTRTANTTKPVKLRHEFKHHLNPGQDLLLASRLRKLFPHDKNADSHGSYRVSSLYFDTPSDRALRQKIDGVNQREKFRLRYYNDDLSFIRLEKKYKINGLCGKRGAGHCSAGIQKRKFALKEPAVIRMILRLFVFPADGFFKRFHIKRFLGMVEHHANRACLLERLG